MLYKYLSSIRKFALHYLLFASFLVLESINFIYRVYMKSVPGLKDQIISFYIYFDRQLMFIHLLDFKKVRIILIII